MGIITSRFRGKLSTIEVLEKIEKDITKLENNRRQNQELQKKVAASLLLYSVLLYIFGAAVFYFLYYPDNWRDRLFYSLPLFIFPFLIWGARKLMHWYFIKRLSSNDIALNELREKKKLILEDVMEKETYKKAKEILEKFDPVRFKKLEKPPEPQIQAVTPGTVVRHRVARMQTVSPRMQAPMVAGPSTKATPHHLHRAHIRPQMPMSTPGPRPMVSIGYSPPPGPPMPRTVLPRDRGTMDKLIDFLVGDGPQSRFALICRFCSSHNGMALAEEFEYLSFRCCYCYNVNPARKQRSFAPKLDFLQLPPGAAASPVVSGSVAGHKPISKGGDVNTTTVTEKSLQESSGVTQEEAQVDSDNDVDEEEDLGEQSCLSDLDIDLLPESINSIDETVQKSLDPHTVSGAVPPVHAIENKEAGLSVQSLAQGDSH